MRSVANYSCGLMVLIDVNLGEMFCSMVPAVIPSENPGVGSTKDVSIVEASLEIS